MAKALNHRQFRMLLDEVDSMYSDLLLYNKVRWLSRGEVLKRFVVCLKEVKTFLDSKGLNYPQLKKAELAGKTTLYSRLDGAPEHAQYSSSRERTHSPAYAGRCFGIRTKVHGLC